MNFRESDSQETGVFKKLRNAMLVMSVAQQSYGIGKAGWAWGKSLRAFQLSVSQDDPIYNDLHRWLIDQLGPRKLRKLEAFTDEKRDFSTPNNDRTTSLAFRYKGEIVQTVNLNGHKVCVWVSDQGAQKPTGGQEEQALVSTWRMIPKEINFQAFSHEGREEISNLLAATIASHFEQDQKTKFYLPASWGAEFQSRSDIPHRDLDSIILKEGQLERLIEDIDNFRKQKELYESLNLCWRRGYVFFGPPGSGKTSLARALSSHYGADVYSIPLASVKKDGDLLALFSQVTKGSLLLLEDIDRMNGTDGNTELTPSGLLNALDGIGTPENLIIIMTTNNLDALDPALIRPGRVDIREEIGYLDSYQLDNLVQYFYKTPCMIKVDKDVAPAQIIEIFKTHPNDSTTGLKLIKKLCS